MENRVTKPKTAEGPRNTKAQEPLLRTSGRISLSDNPAKNTHTLRKKGKLLPDLAAKLTPAMLPPPNPINAPTEGHVSSTYRSHKID